LGAGATYYSPNSLSVSNVVGYYKYADLTCKGITFSGTGYSLKVYNPCYLGTRVSCSNNEFSVNTYTNYDCTGNITTSLKYPVGTCINGTQAFCSGSLNAPANFVANVLYAGQTDCNQDFTFIQFTALDVCISLGTASVNVVYDSFYKEVNLYEFTASPNCTVGTPNASTQIKN